MKYKITLLILLTVFQFVSCVDNTRAIQYTLSCSNCDITYENSSGNTEQKDNVSSSWKYSFNAEVNTFVYLSAQNSNNSGTVTVTIKSDGKVIETATSTGAYVIATASGSVPE